MNAELVEFTRQALAKGATRPEIEGVLRQAGWQQADIDAALDAFADVPFAVPVPRPRPYLSAREVFVYLVMFFSLYVAVFHLGSLVFHLIDNAFPDPALKSPRRLAEAVRWDVSAMVIAFPLFLLTFRATARAIAAKPDLRGSKPRKWLTYLTLFLAAATLAVDLTVLVYNLLGGGLTAPFLLKVAVVAILAGGSFAYFLGEMRRDERQ